MWFWLATVASAQVNADVLASQVATPGPALGLKGGVALSAGNVNSLVWIGEAAVQYLTLYDDPAGPPPWFRDRVLVFGSARRAAYDGQVEESEGLVHTRYTRMWIPKLGTEVFGQLQYNRFLLLSERTLAGGGVRVDVVHRPGVGVWGGTGAMFEHETLSDGAESAIARSTSYAAARWTLTPDRLTLVNTTYFQPRIDDPADLRILEEGRIESKINKVLSLGTELVIRYDSRPPEGVERTDLRFGTTLQLRLSKRP